MQCIIPLLLFLMAISGCAASSNTSIHQTASLSPTQAAYYRAILNWQDRLDTRSFQNFDCPQLGSLRQKIANDGWNNTTVDDVIEEIRKMTSLTMETKDHWDTPKEFAARNYQGDCEDVAIFLLAMLKKLDYPGQVRVFAVKSQFVEHAMLKVRMPDNSWKVFETVMKTERSMHLAYTPIVEFDDREIVFATI